MTNTKRVHSCLFQHVTSTDELLLASLLCKIFSIDSNIVDSEWRITQAHYVQSIPPDMVRR